MQRQYCDDCANKEELAIYPQNRDFGTCQFCGKKKIISIDRTGILTSKSDKEKMKKKKRFKLIEDTARMLIAATGQTTTLEVKKALRQSQPNESWKQKDISSAMELIEIENSDLTYHDNGTFRTYTTHTNLSAQAQSTSTPASQTKAKKSKKAKKLSKAPVKSTAPDKRVSRSMISNLISNSKGRFFTLEFTKKNGDTRVMNGQVRKSNLMNGLGYFNVTERLGKGQSQQRQVDPRTITRLTLSGVTYRVK